MKDIKDKNDKEKIWRFFKTYMYAQKNKLIFLVILIFVGSLIGNISPYLYGKMLDSISSGNMNYLIKLIAVYFIVTMITTLLSIYEGYLGQIINFKMSKNIQKRIFDKMIRMRTSAYSQYDTGEFINRLNGDADGIVSFVINVITSILQIVVNIAISLYFVFTISMHLTSVALFYIPASFIVTFFARKYFKKLAEQRKAFNDQYYNFQTEVFSNNAGIKSYILEDSMTKKFENFISKDFKILRRSIYLNNRVEFINNLITVISSLYVIYLSAILIKSNMLTIGTMVSFNTYINKLFSSISQVLGFNISKQEVMVSLNRVIEVMSEESEEKDGYRSLEVFENPMIAISKVNFSYNEDNSNVLNNFSLQITSPGFYSLVGKNGCGKSTIAKILIKLYDIQSGEISFNHKDYKDISYEAIRNKITYVQKEDFFFNDTIFNNIRLANTDLTNEEIINMCKKVDLDEFINTLPEKYETAIGEGGSTFSSGQKQKLSIARALLRKTKIYVFDEVTANLDGKSEKNIISILKEESKDSIIIFISHKISSIIESDKIFLMDDGIIADSGTHETLLKNNSLYNELFKNIY